MNIGDKFGQLTVTELRGKNAVCACSCGAKGIIREAKSLEHSMAASRLVFNGEPKCRKCASEHRKKRGTHRENLAKGKAMEAKA